MKKVAALSAFVAALAAAIAVTQYYSKPKTPAPRPVPPSVMTTPSTTAGLDASVVTFKTQLVTLDLAAKKAHVTLTLERAPTGAAPQSVWVWAYFFTPDSPTRYCAGDPVEVKQPFASGGHASVTVDATVGDCPAPRTPSSTYYARANVSAESAFAARLAESRINYDITQASPVTLEGAQAKKH